MLDRHLYEIADAILQNSKTKTFNVGDYTLGTPQAVQKALISDTSSVNNPIENNDNNLKTLLTDFRLRRSKELEVKPYYIFTNKILDSLLEKKPLTTEQLLEIEGIGHKKAEEFGNDILSIIQSSFSKETLPKNSHTKDSQANANKSLPKEKSSVQSTKASLDGLRVSLTEFRTRRSKELNVKPFYIFTNKTLEAILDERPETMEELLKVEGIGQKKSEEFGQEILDIIQVENEN